MEYSSSSHKNSSPWLSVSSFEAFSSSNTALAIDSTTITTTTTGFQREHHVPIFTGGQKLENFLGGSQFPAINNNTIACTNPNSNAAATPATEISPTAAKRSVDNFGQRTSIYRGVTRHRWTGRYEAHLWDNSCRREGQSRKGRQVYLGGYDKEEKAARAYDLAALKYWGLKTLTNLPVSNYEKELEAMKNMTRQEFVASLRRKSSGFSRGASIYRGVTRHHQHGRWQARIGRVAGNKDLYLGTFSTQEEAAEAYDIAAIKFRGLNAVTNFDMSRYDINSIATNNLPIGGISNPKPISQSSSESVDHNFDAESSVSMLSFSIPIPIPIIKQNPNNHNKSPECWSDIFGFQNPNVFITKSDADPSIKTPLTVSDHHDPHQRLQENCGYDQSSSITSSRYNVNGFEQNNSINSVGPSLQSFHGHTQVKPVALFQTPILGVD